MFRAIFAALVLSAAVATPLWSDSAGTARESTGSSAPQAELKAVQGPADPATTSDKKSAKKSAAGKYQRKAFNATNARRADHGRKELRKQDCIQGFAVRQAKAMAAKKEMYHQELGPILKQCGLNAVGENVAYGYATGRSVVNDGWMNSDGHRANILNPDFRLMGIGARQSKDGTWYVAQVFGRKG